MTRVCVDQRRMRQGIVRQNPVLLFDRTLEGAPGGHRAHPIAPVPVKGLPEPVELYELLRARPV
jgi:hypothetical protein